MADLMSHPSTAVENPHLTLKTVTPLSRGPFAFGFFYRYVSMNEGQVVIDFVAKYSSITYSSAPCSTSEKHA